MNSNPDKKKGNQRNYLIKIGTACLVVLLGSVLKAAEQSDPLSPGISALVEGVPAPYEKALRNPVMGFTTRGIYAQPWATLAQTYIRWNEMENDQSDGIDKIRQVTNEKWGDIASRNIKVIPRVYLYWNGNQKYWPADMKPDDYTSEQFQ